MAKPLYKSNMKNFFSENIKKSGEGFLEAMNAKQLRNVSRRVFTDIARSNIDFDKYWTYFTVPMFIDALVDVAYTSMTIHGTDLSMYEQSRVSGYSTDVTETMYRYHKRHYEAYTMLFECFNNLKSNAYQVDISRLKILSNRLREYANDLIDPIFSSNAVTPHVAVYNPPKYVDLMAEPVDEQPDNGEAFYSEFTMKPDKVQEEFFPTFTIANEGEI